MKRLVVVFIIVALSAVTVIAAFAEESKAVGFVKGLLSKAILPIETVIGPLTELEKIVVTPSRIGEKIGAASSSISIVDEKDFDRKKISTVKDALKDEVGIDISQIGAFQGSASILTRGGKPNHTLVMVDGLKAYDPISPGGEYNIAHLTLDNVERIEILRGAQSALYGSDAMAGVINIVSKKAEDTYVNALFEAGSFFTYKEQFSAGSVAHGFHYSIAGSRLDTQGISQADAKSNCQERDPYDKTSVAVRVDYDMSEKSSVGASVRHSESNYAFDQGSDADDDNSFSSLTEDFVTLNADQEIVQWWDHSLKMGWMESKRQYFDDDSPGFDFDRSKYYGKYFKLDYQNVFDLFGIDKVIAGYEYTEEMAEYYSQNDYSGAMAAESMPKVFSREGDAYLENRVNVSDRLTSTQGARVSHHSRAGTNMTYRIDGSYLFFSGTKIRGLTATGFKAPSLYQLFAPANVFFGGGNPALQPEKSLSYEYGIDQYIFGDKVISGVTYYYTLYENLIDALTDPNTFFTGQYINIGKAQVHGIEATLKVKPIESVRASIGFTYQKTKDFQNDQEMVRRPERKFFAECFWQATKKLSIEGKLRYNGPMSDNLSNPLWGLNTYKLKEFTIIDGIVNYEATKHLAFYLRAENMFNKTYHESRGFGEPPFALYGGVKASF